MRKTSESPIQLSFRYDGPLYSEVGSATRQQVPTIKKGVSGVNVEKTQLKYNSPLW